MYRSYFKIGWRNLIRDKGYSVVNIGRFALGIAVAMLIGLWVFDEMSYQQTPRTLRQYCRSAPA